MSWKHQTRKLHAHIIIWWKFKAAPINIICSRVAEKKICPERGQQLKQFMAGAAAPLFCMLHLFISLSALVQSTFKMH